MTRAPILSALALLGFVAAAGAAHAQNEINLGRVLEPAFEGADSSLVQAGMLGAEGPAAPVVLPAVDALRDGILTLRELAYTIILGLAGGDAGSDVGTPDRAGAILPAAHATAEVGAPGVAYGVSSRTVPVATPGLGYTVYTPPVRTPPVTANVPGARVPVVVPPVSTPPLTIHVPERHVDTPPVNSPPVVVNLPPVTFPPRETRVDAGGAGAGFQGAHGTIYAGPARVPFDVPAVSVTLNQVTPPGVPTSVTVPGRIVDEPGRTLLDEPSRHLLDAQSATTPGVRRDVEGMPVTDAARVGDVVIGGSTAGIPSRSIAEASYTRVEVPGQTAGAVTLPGAGVQTAPVSVASVPVDTPAVAYVVEHPAPVDDLGYFGYGLDGDSSLYPYACALGACAQTQYWLGGYVRAADRYLDAVARIVDDGYVLDLRYVYVPYVGPFVTPQ